MTSSDQRPPGLRERTRLAVRAEIADAACALFVEQGFEATSVEQIVARVGIARSGFFRYFASKEDVLLGTLDDVPAILGAALEARPVDEPLWVALRTAVEPVLDRYRENPRIALRMERLIARSPALASGRLARQAGWRDALLAADAVRTDAARGAPRQEMAPRSTNGTPPTKRHSSNQAPNEADASGADASGPGASGAGTLRRAAAVAAALACLTEAVTAWAASGGRTDLGALTDTAFGAVGPAGD